MTEIQAQEFGEERQKVDSRDKGMCIEMSICRIVVEQLRLLNANDNNNNSELNRNKVTS